MKKYLHLTQLLDGQIRQLEILKGVMAKELSS